MGGGPSVEQIYREHHAFVWRIVRRLGVPAEAVDDAVQEVFVVVHRRRDELDVSGPPRGLLYGIARRIAKRQRDKAAARSHLRVMAPAESGDPERSAVLREKADVVRGALDGMDEDKRMTFVLADVEGMTMPEVARCLDVNLNTAYARLRAARQRVAKAVARHRAAEEGVRVRRMGR